jgi:ubiquinone/menaquinone biosynthesis C-methylase UbiE
MSHCVCPWWLGYLLVSPLRRLYQDPDTILGPWVADGMTVLEPGPGMGFFTLELARRVGPRGRVVAVDVQAKMLETLVRRARRAGLDERIDARATSGETLGIDDLVGKVDFVLAFAVLHELPSTASFFAEAHRALRPGGRLLVAEPTGHVSAGAMAETLALARGAGFAQEGSPRIRGSHAAVLSRRDQA